MFHGGRLLRLDKRPPGYVRCQRLAGLRNFRLFAALMRALAAHPQCGRHDKCHQGHRQDCSQIGPGRSRAGGLPPFDGRRSLSRSVEPLQRKIDRRFAPRGCGWRRVGQRQGKIVPVRHSHPPAAQGRHKMFKAGMQDHDAILCGKERHFGRGLLVPGRRGAPAPHHCSAAMEHAVLAARTSWMNSLR